MSQADLKCACLLGARKDSQRLPGKNRLPLQGVPLYERALRGVLEAGVFSPVIVSTDDEFILEGVQRYSEVVPDRRPAHLANGESSMWEVLRHVLGTFARELEDVEAICLVTPCHPFRTAAMLREALLLFQETQAQSLVSVTPFPCPPALALEVEGGLVRRNWSGLVRSAEHKTSYYPNGMISILSLSSFLKNGDVYTDKTVAYVTPWPNSLDIDYVEDMELARLLAPCMVIGESQTMGTPPGGELGF